MMARKFLYAIAGLVVLVLAALLVLRVWSRELTEFAFVPRGSFETLPHLPRNAYRDPAMWIARPGLRDDPAQYLPPGVARGVPGKARVFFIHPTSYLARNHWNGPIDDVDARFRAALFVRGMASAFNGAAEVWAPRYRQAAFGAFLVDDPAAQRALALAYDDVLLAFDTWLAQIPPDAPIIVAGHSQGSLHLLHLLHDRFAGKPLAGRLVAAYAVGWPVSIEHDLPQTGLPACTGPDASGCLMSWASFAEPADPALLVEAYRRRPALDGRTKGAEPVLCTNPLTGGAAPVAPAAANLGTMVPAKDLLSGRVVPRAVGARCDPASGLLLIGDPPEMGPYVLPGNNYHVYDLPLFWTNVRADIVRREAAWTAARR